ncbi:MAG: DUF4199 domain-containing protein [Alistipes sp.]|nr:DUF4199 domain-containing protein [Alistipes sp.]
MRIKDFWMDVLRAAAIIGVVMAISHIFEQYVMFFSDMSLMQASVTYLIEAMIAAAAFVWLMFYFTRRVARAWNDRVEVGDGIVVDVPFTYGRAVSYGLIISMLVGLFVGVANTLFVDFMGYDLYRAGQLAYLEEIEELMTAYNKMAGSEAISVDVFEGQIDTLEMGERPSMFMNILAHMTAYMLYGGITSLIVAAIARRKPKAQNISNE